MSNTPNKRSYQRSGALCTDEDKYDEQGICSVCRAYKPSELVVTTTCVKCYLKYENTHRCCLDCDGAILTESEVYAMLRRVED